MDAQKIYAYEITLLAAGHLARLVKQQLALFASTGGARRVVPGAVEDYVLPNPNSHQSSRRFELGS